MKYLITIFCFICLTSFNISAEPFCKVTKVVDGDTIHVLCDSQKSIVRLTNIDAFESRKISRAYRQAYEQKISIEEVVIRGKRATEIAKAELYGKKVEIVYPKIFKKDRYSRDLGEIYINGVSINKKLLKEHPDVFLKY